MLVFLQKETRIENARFMYAQKQKKLAISSCTFNASQSFYSKNFERMKNNFCWAKLLMQFKTNHSVWNKSVIPVRLRKSHGVSVISTPHNSNLRRNYFLRYVH